MTALRWAGIACRVVALAMCGYIVWTAGPHALRLVERHEIRLEIRPRGLISEPLERWT